MSTLLVWTYTLSTNSMCHTRYPYIVRAVHILDDEVLGDKEQLLTPTPRTEHVYGKDMVRAILGVCAVSIQTHTYVQYHTG